MANTIKLKSSAVPGKVPSLSDLQVRELALNTADGRLFTRRSSAGIDSIVELTGGGAGSAAFGVVVGDVRTAGDAGDAQANTSSATLTVLGLGGAQVRTDQATDTVYIDSRAVAMAVALG